MTAFAWRGINAEERKIVLGGAAFAVILL